MTKQQNSGLATCSLVFGIVGFFCNPLYVCNLLAVIFGIVALCTGQPKGRSIVGIILGVCAAGVQLVLDLLLFGVGFFF